MSGSVDATSDLIHAQLSADAAWQRAQDLEALNARLTEQNAEHRKRNMRQYYGFQGFMAIKAKLDLYRANIAHSNGNPDALIGQIYEIIREHKANIDKVDSASKG